MTKEIEPREKALRELREQKFQKPKLADVRGKIAKIKPMTRKGGGRGR
jgi:hypothetical protein